MLPLRLSFALLLMGGHLAAADFFQTPGNGKNLGVWRLTNNPAFEDWANYHNEQCWSRDGRYVCYQHNVDDKAAQEAHVFDFHSQEDLTLGRGGETRWANQRNWLFYRRLSPGAGGSRTSEVFWHDFETGKSTVLASLPDETELGGVSCDDRWLYGGRINRQNGGKHTGAFRISISATPALEELPQVQGYQFNTNPAHPVFFTRLKAKREPFGSSRLWYDLDGSNPRLAVPMLQDCHMAWLGSGEYLLLGNGLIRGRRLDQPFPSNVEILAGVHAGDVSPCGRSGRFAAGNMFVADLRSGDGWKYIDHLSMISYPESAGDQSGGSDADHKGSPDGTKIAFVSNYDLEHGPFTAIAQQPAPGEMTLAVRSTEGFPDSGELTINEEVLAYRGKDATHFFALQRGQYGTRQKPLREGAGVTSFAARLLTDEQWQRRGAAAPKPMAHSMEAGSPLLRQRQTDVYVVAIRPPDAPVLQESGDELLLIPGEAHFETAGFRLRAKGGPNTAPELLKGGAERELAVGTYEAIAVEWSGLESAASASVTLTAPKRLKILRDAPPGFTWTSDRWLVGGHPAFPAEARAAAAALREIVHRYDGTIARETFVRGELQEHDDLNTAGAATRRLFYEGGRLARREYYSSDGAPVSREWFDQEGFITETQTYEPHAPAQTSPMEKDHWWFSRGLPVRAEVGRKHFEKRGDRWVPSDGAAPETQPRGGR